MKLLYTIKKYSFSVFAILIVITSLVLQPHTRSILLPLQRNYLKNRFILLSQRQHAIDPQQFWILREYYYPGLIFFNEKGISTSLFKTSFANDSYVTPPSDLFTFINTKSRFSISSEGLTTTTRLYIVNEMKKNATHIFLENEKELLLEKNGILYVYFIKPTADMAMANAFYDVKGRHRDLVANKHWFVAAKFE